MITVTKIMEISYAHQLADYNGKCSNVHGHNAKIELEFVDSLYKPNTQLGLEERTEDGEHTQESGMVLDFSLIKEKVESIIKGDLDHKYLNDIPFFQRVRPTAENMCIYISARINNAIIMGSRANLIRVRVWEDSESYAEWRI